MVHLHGNSERKVKKTNKHGLKRGIVFCQKLFCMGLRKEGKVRKRDLKRGVVLDKEFIRMEI